MAVLSKSEVDLGYEVAFVCDLWVKNQISYFENSNKCFTIEKYIYKKKTPMDSVNI